MPRRQHLKPALQAGSSLVEVAVSLLVISIASLGLAGLQIWAKQLGYQAMQRSEAVSLAADLLERMRANRPALARYAVAGLGAASGAVLQNPVVDCSRASCSVADLSHWDLWQWERALNGAAGGNSAGGLLNPLGCVTISGRLVTVAVAWQGFRDLSDASAGDGCGAGVYGDNDAQRQWLQLTSFISED